MAKPKLIVFASGNKDGGGSGFENLVVKSRGDKPELQAEIVAVVSHHEHGGVRQRADKLDVPFIHFPKPYDAAGYQHLVNATGAEWIALSGWLKLVEGLDPARTFNIHPALLSQLNGRFGGPGMYGHHVHEAVAKALANGEIKESGLTMHFITAEYDRGTVFFEYSVPLSPGMSPDTIEKLVNAAEHEWQPRITNLVIHKTICWDGNNPGTLVTPFTAE